jgi:hypothetical protein
MERVLEFYPLGTGACFQEEGLFQDGNIDLVSGRMPRLDDPGIVAGLNLVKTLSIYFWR